MVNNQHIKNLQNPTEAQDATTKAYLYIWSLGLQLCE